MEQIVSFDRVSSLISSCMRKGVKTNNFLTAGDYLCDIASGSLFPCLARRSFDLRRGRATAGFIFTCLSPFRPDIEINEPVVLNCSKARGQDADTFGILENAGSDCLTEYAFSARSLVRNNTFAEIRGSARSRRTAAGYESCFDRYTGCIPDTTGSGQ